ncbi:MAG: phosphatidylserine decarboxylase family protein [Gemmatimonadetes bacterium]|nr:phosphatidylserine decarboxylase family protein [Gemmatimonadota bacterium]
MKLAPEGRPFVAIAGVLWLGLLAAALGRGGLWWVPLALWTPIAAWVPAFFRDPQRDGPRGAHVVISPADGRVVAIVDEQEPSYMRGRATRVSVFMNVFSVHVNRYPVSGPIEHLEYRPGKFLNAALDKASEHNERASVGIRSAGGPVLVRQIAGLIARRIVTDGIVGGAARQGERLGLIRFGSRVDTFLPPGATLRVRVGDHATAGITVLAEFTT